MSRSFLNQAGIEIQPTHQSARGIDKSPLGVRGEVKFTLNFGELTLPITALVVDSLDCDILSGIPFCRENDIEIPLKSEEISVMGQRIPYGMKPKNSHDIYRAETITLKNKGQQVILPGEFVEVQDDSLVNYEGEVSVEPCLDSVGEIGWPQPHISRVVHGTVRIPNLSDNPVLLKTAEYFAQIRRVRILEDVSYSMPSVHHAYKVNTPIEKSSKLSSVMDNDAGKLSFYKAVTVDPDGLCTKNEKILFEDINKSYNTVFDSNFDAYNDSSGVIRANINFGKSLPPPRKGRLPFYNQANLCLLQEEADKLEKLGVLAKPEDVGVHVQYVSPSFLVKKPLGGYRFVTAFHNTLILPSVSSSCDEVLRKLSSWKYLVKTDLTKSFYQIQVTKSSITYLGTATPFKGLRVYLRSAMGMPGSSEHLRELTSRVLGDMMQEGFVIILHDDFYIRANTILELSENWHKVLQRMYDNNLKLSPDKTIVCPKQTTILGWVWNTVS